MSSMNKLEFSIAGTVITGCHDAAYIAGGEDPREQLGEAVLDNLSTHLDVTVGGVTMFLAAWLDPAHWEEDWAKKLGLASDDDVEGMVDALLIAALTADKAPA